MGTFDYLQIIAFSPTIIENNFKKVFNGKNYTKTCVYWCADFIFVTFMIDTIKYWILLKNYTFVDI